MDMDQIASATAIFLDAARAGELNLLKQSAVILDQLVGIGIPAIFEKCKDGEDGGAIHHAAIGGSVEEMKIDIHAKENLGVTSLSLAAIEGNLAAVEYLLEMGTNPELPDHSNCTPSHLVAQKWCKDAIALLLSKGIDVDITSELGSPLHFAALAGKHDNVQVLLDHGANPNLVFGETYTPLHASITSQSWQSVEALLKVAFLLSGSLGVWTSGHGGSTNHQGADPNGGPVGIKPLPLAAGKGVVQIIKLLVDAGADPNVTTIMICNEKANFLEAKSRGTSASRRKEYRLAVHWYSKALVIKPGDAAVLSNRGMCYVYLKEGDVAFKDATQCILARPDWPKAHYRAGVALKLLNAWRLDDAADAFSNGLKLDPENKELEDAFREVSLDRLKAINVPV